MKRFILNVKLFNTSPIAGQVWLGLYADKDFMVFSPVMEEDFIGITMLREVREKLQQELNCTAEELVGRRVKATLEKREGVIKNGIKKPDYYAIIDAKPYLKEMKEATMHEPQMPVQQSDTVRIDVRKEICYDVSFKYNETRMKALIFNGDDVTSHVSDIEKHLTDCGCKNVTTWGRLKYYEDYLRRAVSNLEIVERVKTFKMKPADV